MVSPSISVCICTFRRPEGLRAVLEGLRAQTGLEHPIQIVVVDNDAAAGGKTQVEALRDSLLPHRVVYDVVPIANIALARNRTVALADGELIAFIDDDEVPSPHWLREMTATMRDCHADAVFGPVLPLLPPDAAHWLVAGRFFERPRHTTGTLVPRGQTATSNAIVRAALIRTLPGPFDPDFGLLGGEDTRLFEALAATGAKYVWCDAGEISESIPPHRCTLKYLLRRSMRGGEAYTRVQIRQYGPWSGIKLAAAGILHSLLLPPIALASLPWGLHSAVWWLRKASAGFGRVLALTPRRVKQYAS